MKKGPLHPAEAKAADAGKKKRVPMTDAEKLQQQQRLKDIEEKEKSGHIKTLTCWISGWMKEHGYNKYQGPFSEDEMNGDPVKVLCTDCYLAIWDGDWRWDEDRKLSSQLIQVAKSKISHIIRDYCKKARPLYTGEMTYSQHKEMERAAGLENWLDIADELDWEISMRDLGLKMARKVSAKKSEYMRYLDVLETVDSYDYIAQDLGMEEKDVYKLERKFLSFLRKKFQKDPAPQKKLVLNL